MEKEDKKFEDSLNFVASHYESDAFSPKEGWKKVRGEVRHFRWQRWGAAAAVACVVLAASAFVYFNSSRSMDVVDQPQSVVAPENPEENMEISRRIEFTDAPIKEIVAKIEEIYKVKVSDVPTEEIRLTLSYEGTASDLIDLINEMAGTHMTVADAR